MTTTEEKRARTRVREALREASARNDARIRTRRLQGDLADETKTALPDEISFLTRLAGAVLEGSESQPEAEPLPDIFEGEKPSFASLDVRRLAWVGPLLREARLAVLPYATANARPDPSDQNVVDQVERLRALLEFVFRERITFKGEAHPSPLNDDEVLSGSDLSKDSQREPPSWRLENRTSQPLTIPTTGTPYVVLPPLGARDDLPFDPTSRFDLAELIAKNEILVLEKEGGRKKDVSDTSLAVLGFAMLLLPLALISFLYLRLDNRKIDWYPWAAWGCFVAIGILVVLGARSGSAISERLRSGRDLAAKLPQFLLEMLTLVIVLAIGIAGTAAALYYAADVRLSDQALLLTGRTIQLVFIAIAAMLPALLYFLFDREHLGTQQQRFMRQIFRFDYEVRTVADVEAKYGTVMTESYGRARSRSGRRVRGNRAPIVVATLLITMGWILVLLNPQIDETTPNFRLIALLEPSKSAVAFGFLGTYFFALYAVLRGYTRRDLQPRFYTQIAVRIVVVAILSWMLEIAFQDSAPHLYVFAFLIGIVPEQALLFLREFVGRRDWPGLDDRQPLTDLEGIDIYDRTRLQSEGVTDIQALAHSDLVELMLRTRIPISQLVDWTDQAILYLHVVNPDRRGRTRRGNEQSEKAAKVEYGEHGGGVTAPATEHDRARSEDGAARDQLRRYGIRTATDLLNAWESLQRDGENMRGRPLTKDQERFLNILGRESEDKPYRLSVIHSAIEDEEWIENLRYWHDPARHRLHDGRGSVPRHAKA